MTFSPFTESDIVKQVFSTRLGGVSKGMYESMNLTFNPVGEYEADFYDRMCIRTLKRMAAELDIPLEKNGVYKSRLRHD